MCCPGRRWSRWSPRPWRCLRKDWMCHSAPWPGRPSGVRSQVALDDLGSLFQTNSATGQPRLDGLRATQGSPGRQGGTHGQGQKAESQLTKPAGTPEPGERGRPSGPPPGPSAPPGACGRIGLRSCQSAPACAHRPLFPSCPRAAGAEIQIPVAVGAEVRLRAGGPGQRTLREQRRRSDGPVHRGEGTARHGPRVVSWGGAELSVSGTAGTQGREGGPVGVRREGRCSLRRALRAG